MRWGHLLTVAVLTGLLVVDPAPAGGQAARTGSLSGVLSPSEIQQLTDEQLQKALQRARRELRNRAIVTEIGARFPRADLRALERTYGLLRLPDFDRVGDVPMKHYVQELATESEKRPLMVYQDDLTYVAAVPTARAPNGRATVADPAVLAAAQSVVAIVPRSALTHHPDTDTWVLAVGPLSTVLSGSFALCEFSTLYGQPAAPLRGTGFLAQPDKVITAGHVAATSDFLASVYFLFGYTLQADGTARTIYGPDDVYEGAQILAQSNQADRDWAVVLLARPVVGYPPLPYRKTGTIPADAMVYVLGYPNGLPLLRSGPSKLENNEPCTIFVTRLDSYPCNSGSPVLNAQDHRVEGILVSDVGNFREYCACRAPAVFGPADGLPGVHVCRSRLFADYLSRPDQLLVRCKADSVNAAIVQTTQLWVVARGEEKEIAFGSPMLLYQVGGDCQLSFYPQPGETWDIVDGPQPGTVYMVRCPDDAATTP